MLLGVDAVEREVEVQRLLHLQAPAVEERVHQPRAVEQPFVDLGVQQHQFEDVARVQEGQQQLRGGVLAVREQGSEAGGRGHGEKDY